MPRIPLIFLAAYISLNLGCAFTPVTPPAVDVVAVRLIWLGLMQQQLAVTLCVTNSNNGEITFRHVTADLDVSGAPLASGTNDLSVKLPAGTSTLVPFTVVTTVQNLGPQLLAIMGSGSVKYRVHGTVTFGGFALPLPYSQSGKLDAFAGTLQLASSIVDPLPTRCSLLSGP